MKKLLGQGLNVDISLQVPVVIKDIGWPGNIGRGQHSFILVSKLYSDCDGYRVVSDMLELVQLSRQRVQTLN